MPSNADVADNLIIMVTNLGRRISFYWDNGDSNSDADAGYLRVVKQHPPSNPNRPVLLAQRRGETAHARSLFLSALRFGHAALEAPVHCADGLLG